MTDLPEVNGYNAMIVVIDKFGKLTWLVGGYMACGIPLIRSANGNGNRIPLNGIPFNGIPFPFVSIMAFLPASVNCRKC